MNRTLFRNILVFMLTTICCFTLSAQQEKYLFTIEGTITNALGVPLRIATINIKGTERGVMAVENGFFSIKASYGDRLVFSCIAHDSHECLVTGETKNLVIMLNDGVGQIPNNPLTTTPNPEWLWIDEMQPEEALAELEKIYWAAMGEKDYGKVVKAITNRIVRQRQILENTTATLLDSLKLDAERLPQPARSVVYSLIADVYRAHFQTNMNQIRGRTRTSVVGDDVNTWDISRLFEESLKYFKLSIQEEELLQQTPVDDYSEALFYVLEKDKNNLTLPTLYDLLAYRAILAFTGELSVTLPQHNIRHQSTCLFCRRPHVYPISVSCY